MKKPVVSVVEDDEQTALSLAEILGCSENLNCGRIYLSAEEMLDHLEEGGELPDIVLVDLSLGLITGQELIASLRQSYPQIVCVAHTVYEDEESVLEALRAGAQGYLVKGCTGEQLVKSLLSLEEGGAPLTPRVARFLLKEFQQESSSPLSPREQEVLGGLESGLSYKQCASKMTVSVHTVHSHVKKIYEKLGVHNKREAVDKAKRKGWLSSG